jgi:hypothetical protein
MMLRGQSIYGEMEITVHEPHQTLSWFSAWSDMNREIPQDLIERSDAVTTVLYKTCPMAFRECPDNRYACNATQALRLLAHHGNSRIPDTLAILANLCNFPLRLNTVSLENSELTVLEYSFSVCAYVLAIVNGDMSLLFGGKIQHEERSESAKEQNSWGPSGTY